MLNVKGQSSIVLKFMFDFLKNKNQKDSGVFVVFDIGGTKMRVAVSHDGKTFDEPKIAPTPSNFDEAMIAFKKLADEAKGSLKIRALCGGIPGVLNRDRKTIFKLPNLPEWDGQPLEARLKAMFNAPIYLENDTALVGLGEAVNGAGRGYGIVVYITVSTGVGGVRIEDGSIDRKTIGFEPGHQIINFADFKNKTGGDLESYISGSALSKKFGKEAKDIIDTDVHEDLAYFLAYGLHNTIMHWSPDIVVLGGPIIMNHHLMSVAKVEEHLRTLLSEFPEIPVIKKAELGDFGGLYGALVFLSKNEPKDRP